VTGFHIRPESVRGDRVTFDPDEAHHLSHVLRLEPGAMVKAVDGRGLEITVRLTRVGGQAAEGDIVSRSVPGSESPLSLTLAQGIPKGAKLDLIIRMATELGVALVMPLFLERTIARPEPSEPSHRLLRWRRIAKEAAKQSGRAVIPEVRAPLTLDQWLAEPTARGLLLCLWEGERTPLAAVLPSLPPARATVVIGPEGGLSPAEVERLRAAGALVAGLGPRILRTETAGPVALALLQARYGDLGRER
jgi:16S rRNA (uracil1498-N3)-methyltransferase